MVAGTFDDGLNEIVAAVQNYEWGLHGSSSLVAKLWTANSGEKIDEGKPYAEVNNTGLLLLSNS